MDSKHVPGDGGSGFATISQSTHTATRSVVSGSTAALIRRATAVASGTTGTSGAATAAAKPSIGVSVSSTPYSAVLEINTRNKRTTHISLREAEAVLSDSRVFVSSDVPSLTSDRCNRLEVGRTGLVSCSGGLSRHASTTDPHYTKKLTLSAEALVDSLSHSNAIRAHTRTRLMSLPLRVVPSYHHTSVPGHGVNNTVTQREFKGDAFGVNAFGKLELAKHAPSQIGASEQAKKASHKALADQITAVKRSRGAGVRKPPKHNGKKFWTTAGSTNHQITFELYTRTTRTTPRSRHVTRWNVMTCAM